MRVVFMGTADFAVPSLAKLIQAANVELLAVVTQLDKPVGRKKIISPAPVKQFCLQQNLTVPILQPEKISSDEEFITQMNELKPDLLITVAYGQILKPNILNLAPRGVINLHASLLPRFRGPAPINWMIIHGENEVGVSTMQTDPGVDTGDILLQASTSLGTNETAVDLGKRLAEIGADLLLETICNLETIKPIKQNLDGVDPSQVLAPFMDRSLGLIDFTEPYLSLRSANKKQTEFLLRKETSAENVYNLFRALDPWPGTAFMYAGKKISLLKIQPSDLSGDPGQIIATDKDRASIHIACQKNSIEILELKPEGKQAMSAYAWYNGLR